MKLYFEILKLEKDGVVRLDDNKACKFHDIGTIRLTIFDDREFLLRDVRYVPNFK